MKVILAAMALLASGAALAEGPAVSQDPMGMTCLLYTSPSPRD